MQSVINYIVGILREPALFIGFIAFLGLALQRKSLSDIIKGTTKAIIGMLVLMQGVAFISSGVTPLATAFEGLFAIEGSGSLASMGDLMVDYGAEIGIVMLLGFVINIAIARFTRFKSIYLTGQLLFWFAYLFIAAGVESGITGTQLIVFAAIFQGAVMVISPAIAKPLVKNLTGSDDFTIGHTTTPFCFIGDRIGRLVGNPEQSAENVKMPKGLDFFRDTTVTAGVVITVVYIVVLALVGGELRATMLGGRDIFTYSIINGMTFAGGMVVLLAGTRMMVTEIVPAFKGISEKLVPGATPALDVPIIFPYGQNSLLIGFVTAMITSIITLFIIGSTGQLSYAVIPLTIACYFDVAPGAIFANKRGGVKAAVLSSAISGALLILLVVWTMPMVANTAGEFIQVYGGNEFSIVTAIANFIGSLWPF